MTEFWQEVHIRAAAAIADQVCHEMAELGCVGTTVEERTLDTFIPPDPDEILSDTYLLKAYFPAQDHSADLKQRILERLAWLSELFPEQAPCLEAVLEIRNEDWAENWKQHFGLQHIGRLVVRPTWEAYRPEAGEAVVVLDPGMAFGTGSHATTRLCLEALADLFQQPPFPDRVLDVGTGSGILAVAAAALGATRVLACDIEATACSVAREYALANVVAERIEITLSPVVELPGQYQVVLANILAEENCRLAEQLVAHLAPGGSLVLSGILQEKEAMVIKAFAPFALDGPQVRRGEEWSCLVYRKG